MVLTLSLAQTPCDFGCSKVTQWLAGVSRALHLRPHLSWSMVSQVLGLTRSVHTFREALELPDTAAPNANFPCPRAATFTLTRLLLSTVSWKWMGLTHSTAEARPKVRPYPADCTCPTLVGDL